MGKNLFNAFSSLKLTVACLVLGCVLVFWGTLAQVHLGLYQAQEEFFRSLFVYWRPGGGSFRIPIFPGGYFIGTLLLINLLGAHLRFYQPGKRKIGIMLIHVGVMLLLVGQMLTDFLAHESVMHLRIGETKNYTVAQRDFELAVTDTTDQQSERVVAIPADLLARQGEVSEPGVPFTIRVKTYYANSDLSQKSAEGLQQIQTTDGYGNGFWWRETPRETAMDTADEPSAIIELDAPPGASHTFLVSAFLSQPQTFTFSGRSYELLLRPTRFYLPFSLQLLQFHHDDYPGTDIPKNFSSRVRVQNPRNREDREVLIYMNNPLRYDGLTFYQASYDPDDGGSILQVVRNPGWLTPYLSCALVGLGLVVQFLSHLVPFLKRRLRS